MRVFRSFPTLLALGSIMFGMFGCKKSNEPPPSAAIDTPFQATFRVPGMT
jgi:hypothetical protein